jgi:pantothenate kinase type III
MTEQTPWLLIDVGNTAIKWRLANAEGLLDAGGSVSDVLSLCQRVEAEPGAWWGWRVLPAIRLTPS